MPEMNGDEASRTIREHGIKLPIIALSGELAGCSRSGSVTQPCNRLSFYASHECLACFRHYIGPLLIWQGTSFPMKVLCAPPASAALFRRCLNLSHCSMSILSCLSCSEPHELVWFAACQAPGSSSRYGSLRCVAARSLAADEFPESGTPNLAIRSLNSSHF